MDLVGIMHVVDMPSSGKCDFNYLCSWSDIVHFDPLGTSSVWYSSVHIDFLSYHNVHPMSMIGPWMSMVWFRLVVPRALVPVVM